MVFLDLYLMEENLKPIPLCSWWWPGIHSWHMHTRKAPCACLCVCVCVSEGGGGWEGVVGWIVSSNINFTTSPYDYNCFYGVYQLPPGSALLCIRIPKFGKGNQIPVDRKKLDAREVICLIKYNVKWPLCILRKSGVLWSMTWRNCTFFPRIFLSCQLAENCGLFPCIKKKKKLKCLKCLILGNYRFTCSCKE